MRLFNSDTDGMLYSPLTPAYQVVEVTPIPFLCVSLKCVSACVQAAIQESVANIKAASGKDVEP